MTCFLHMQARQDLPHLPTVLFEEWLDNRITNHGWPPVEPLWWKIMHNRPLSFWQRLRWRTESLRLETLPYTRISQEIFDNLYESGVCGKTTIHGRYMGDELTDRYRQILPHLIRHGRMPGTPAFLVDESGMYQIVDGCHRVSLYLGLKRDFSEKITFNPNQDILVGRLGDAPKK